MLPSSTISCTCTWQLLTARQQNAAATNATPAATHQSMQTTFAAPEPCDNNHDSMARKNTVSNTEQQRHPVLWYSSAHQLHATSQLQQPLLLFHLCKHAVSCQLLYTQPCSSALLNGLLQVKPSTSCHLQNSNTISCLQEVMDTVCCYATFPQYSPAA